MRKLLTLLLSACAGVSLYGQTISVKDTLMTTYPFGNPDPVARVGKIYPYWRFQGFTTEPELQSWKMVVLENPYLRVKIFPQIGGKVWSIYDKKAGRELVYDNDVVKFREISLRGPWTSGGIEFNYGVIGHAPSCSTPVDWQTEYKADGSVSCYIGVFEMTSRSRWTIEVNLPKDAAYCRTRSIWYNLSGEWQPYYSWANSAVETSDDFVLVYPADNAIGHMGEIETYPLNEQGVDISLLSNQAYGQDKSYHMIGSHKSFFGAYFPSDDWASMHWSLRDEKLGRKYFTWAQSEQGNIWIDLLTDNRPQYVEMQSGRLYNQNEVGCCNDTPYRQILFSPYGTDEWSDFWLPVKGIGIADNVTPDAAVSVNGGKIGIFPLKPSDEVMTVTDREGKVLYCSRISFIPSVPFTLDVDVAPAIIRLGRHIIWQEDDEKVERPQTRVDGFDSGSAEGLTLLAHDLMGLRMFGEAEDKVDSALVMSPLLIDALCLKTALLYRRMAYQEAFEYSDKALSINQYSAEAGYFGGLAAASLGKEFDAMDRLEVAAIVDGPLRSACYTELARIRLKRGDVEIARDYARKAMYSNGRNVTALMLLCCTATASEDEIMRIDPLSHFPSAMKFLRGEIGADALAATFQEELPWEDYMELALFFHSIGMDAEAARILSVSEQNVLTALWQAYLNGDSSAIAPALAMPMDFAFPFRAESASMLEWVNANGGGWQGRYLLALLKDSFGYCNEAARLMNGEDADYAPYYAYRYSLTYNTADLRRAFSLNPEDSRYRRMLAVDLNGKGDYSEALALLKSYYAAHPDNFQFGDALMDAYIGLGKYRDAEKIIDRITYLPFEGMRGSHNKYRHIKLHLAAEACDRGRYREALSLVDEALLWPARLGAGKPYDELIDTSQEQWVREQIEARRDGKVSGKLLPLLEDQRTTDKKLF